MRLNRDEFIETGYLILRNVVPQDKLEALRTSYEIAVERQKAIWARERGPDDPPGGVWETEPQPRVYLHNTPGLIDEQTVSAVDFWLHENTLGVSAQLLAKADPAVTEMLMMCSPVRDHGPDVWHRDLHPIDTAPLQGYVDDLLENGPSYVQWNIPLYDDDVLWVVPGSHRRFNTAEEDRQLLEDQRVPLPGGIPVALRAGDGVVYITPILHWASNYSRKLRRTIHGGFAMHTPCHDLSYTRFLSAADRAKFERWAQRSVQMQDQTEATLRAAINRDATGFRDGLEKLHPGRGPKGKRLLTVFLTRAALFIWMAHHPHPSTDSASRLGGDLEEIRLWMKRGHPSTLNWGPAFADRFSPAQSQMLWERFAVLDAWLQADEKHFAPGFRGQPMRYFFKEMPADLDVESFIRSWGT